VGGVRSNRVTSSLQGCCYAANWQFPVGIKITKD